ncbi:MAG: ATP-dependent sacrificial sulfur transferase LarE [Clostridia bacterium]|nr:ATP-dependent sacrificial sulfur transferase LarE [Clostridia bacterium]
MIENLRKEIRKYDSLAVAFSGGVDSTLLCQVAYEVLKEKAIAITIHGSMHANYEIEEAKALAKQIGIKHIIYKVDAFSIEGFKENGPKRCYYCKKAIFSTIQELALKEGIKNIADGSNVDDLGDYRPGMQALRELNVVSPLMDAGLTKEMIRSLSHDYNLPTWDKAAFACLATRIPTHIEINHELLRQIENAEVYLMEKGFNQYRVRCHGDLARIEVAPEEIQRFYDLEFMAQVDEAFKSFGFRYVALDMKGYKKGNMNHV